MVKRNAVKVGASCPADTHYLGSSRNGEGSDSTKNSFVESKSWLASGDEGEFGTTAGTLISCEKIFVSRSSRLSGKKPFEG